MSWQEAVVRLIPTAVAAVRPAFYEPKPEVRRTRARAAAEIQRIILERFPHRREELLQRSADYEYARAQRVNEEKDRTA